MIGFTKIIAAGALAVGMSAGMAGAATCSIDAKGGQKISYTLDVASSAHCSTGNDKINNSDELFGLSGWILADKNDDAKSGDQKLTFSNALVNGGKSGTWSILNSSGYSNVFITLKAGNGFGAFLLSGTSLMDGSWATSKDLSHASIYYQGEPVPSAVPLPAAGFLLAGALGALALRRRRKA